MARNGISPGELVDLTGKRAVVTGGSRGIGRAAALMLARAGAGVGIGYRSRSGEAEETVAAIRKLGVSAWAQAADLSKPEGGTRLFERCDAEFDGLDVFVANAGVWNVDYVPLAEMTDSQWTEMMAANLDSVFHTTREAVRRLSDGGRIVVVSSTAGQRGEAGHAHYAATKGALGSFVKSLAVELGGRGITVNAVAPGWVETDMTAEPLEGRGREEIVAEIPLGRIAGADDIAGPIVFLCSDLARHVTGEILNVNGGSVLCG